jgi:hypothetical protein
MTAEQRYDFFYERDIQFYSSDHYAWYEEFESGDIFLHHRFKSPSLYRDWGRSARAYQDRLAREALTPGQPPPAEQDGRDLIEATAKNK